jgi:hypothetical protein
MYNITVNTGTALYTVTNLGPQTSWAAVEINGQGPICFNDVGTNPFGPNPNNQQFGVCITFLDSVWAFRYNAGQGDLVITYNAGNPLTITPTTGGTVTPLTSALQPARQRGQGV